ncbi:ankyrin repeat-containing protein [Anaeramoeba flamelloides]|uniref:Ankyrin repeat-containing protein n=1 Tax=Anaeramoeba flamelloides TaxID=1746091 RepID=A0AAV7Y7G7_9EUKA|nr:ankyrin repeat-containing protein [Anaeramoeba flamelloides]
MTINFSPIQLEVLQTGTLSNIQLFISSKLLSRYLTNHKWNALHIVCRYNPQITLLEFLTKNGVTAMGITERGLSPLHLLCRYHPNCKTQLDYLLSNYDLDVNVRDNEGWTPLHYLTRYQPSIKNIKFLLKKGAQVSLVTNEGSTPLMLLCRSTKRNLKSMKTLLKAGADPKVLTKKGWSPILFICRYATTTVQSPSIFLNKEDNTNQNDRHDINNQNVNNQKTFFVNLNIKENFLTKKEKNNKNLNIINTKEREIKIDNEREISYQKAKEHEKEHEKEKEKKKEQETQKRIHNNERVTFQQDILKKENTQKNKITFSTQKDLKYIKLLIENGCNIKIKEKVNNWTALHLACKYRSAEIELITFLLNLREFDVNDTILFSGMTCLHLVCVCFETLNPKLIFLLLDKFNANPDAIDKNWFTPLHYLCRHYNKPVKKQTNILNGKKNIYNHSKNEIISQEHESNFKNKNRKVNEFEIISKKVKETENEKDQENKENVNDNENDNNNENEKENIIENTKAKEKDIKQLESIKILLEFHSNINCKNVDGWTPLHMACRYQNQLKKIIPLIKAGGNVNSKDLRNWRPLHFACRYFANVEIVNYLIKNGAKINVITKDNFTPLHFCALSQNQQNAAQCAKLLISNGADLYLKARKTALDLSIELYNHPVTEEIRLGLENIENIEQKEILEILKEQKNKTGKQLTEQLDQLKKQNKLFKEEKIYLINENRELRFNREQYLGLSTNKNKKELQIKKKMTKLKKLENSINKYYEIEKNMQTQLQQLEKINQKLLNDNKKNSQLLNNLLGKKKLKSNSNSKLKRKRKKKKKKKKLKIKRSLKKYK